MRSSITMEWRFYFQLYTFTAGALLYLFLAVLLGALRKVRLPESLLFLGWIALFLFYSGGLLGMNVAIQYHTPPPGILLLAFSLVLAGLAPAPPLLVHAQAEFLVRLRGERPRWMSTALTLFYLPALYLLIVFVPALTSQGLFEALDAVSSPAWRMGYAVWLALAFVASAGLEWALARRQTTALHSTTARALAALFLLGGVLSVAAAWRGTLGAADELLQTLIAVLIFIPVLAGALVIYVLRLSLLGTGLQRSLVYSVVLAFVALIYLTLARRLSVWLEPLGFPPEATVSILLFIFVLFIQPVQKRVAGLLERTLQRQTEKLHALTAEIQQVARAGNIEDLVAFAEKRIGEAFELAGVRIVLRRGPARPTLTSGAAAHFALRNGLEEIGTLETHYYGQVLSGETRAALEDLAGQLPAAIDLCHLLEEKVRLERELAERERLALLGQMAQTIHHNMKNPLGQMKMILQVQLENSGLAAESRRDFETIVAAIDRLLATLQQLREGYQTPVRGAGTAIVDAAEVIGEAVALLARGAEQRGVSVTAERPAGVRLAGSKEAILDILQNLLVNAVEAAPDGGAVSLQVEAGAGDGRCVVSVTDDGAGIPPELRERIFQPYFTTKASGSGLGLVIVARRLKELGGSLECISPVKEGRGTRFVVQLPLAGVQ